MENGDGEIANRGHYQSAGATTDPATIFIEGQIADVMEPIFNTPVAAAGAAPLIPIALTVAVTRYASLVLYSSGATSGCCSL